MSGSADSPGLDHHLAELTKVVFQSGMGRQVVEAKWDGFTQAFDGFDPVKVSGLTPGDVERLLTDARIIRNRRKIDATIRNAERLLEIDEQFAEGSGSSSGDGVRAWLRSFGSAADRDRAVVDAFAFVGPTGVHQFLYGVGEDVSIDCEVTT